MNTKTSSPFSRPSRTGRTGRTSRLSRLSRLSPALLLLVVLAWISAADLKGKWKFASVETSEPALNALIKDYKFADTLVEFTSAGTVKISGRDTGVKYRLKDGKASFSGGDADKLSKPEVRVEETKNTLKLTFPPELTREIVLLAKDKYVQTGGDALIAKLVENAVTSKAIETRLFLKRN
jgi:hypothetical protein